MKRGLIILTLLVCFAVGSAMVQTKCAVSRRRTIKLQRCKERWHPLDAAKCPLRDNSGSYGKCQSRVTVDKKHLCNAVLYRSSFVAAARLRRQYCLCRVAVK